MSERKITFNIGTGRSAVIDYEGDFSTEDLYTLYGQCLVDVLKQLAPVERLKAVEELTEHIAAAISLSVIQDVAGNPELQEDIMKHIKKVAEEE